MARSPQAIRARAGKLLGGDVRQSDGLGDSERHERGLLNRGQRYVDDSRGAVGDDRMRELERQPALARSPRPGQRDQSH